MDLVHARGFCVSQKHLHLCGPSEAKCHIGTVLSVIPLSVSLSVHLSCLAFAGVTCLLQKTGFYWNKINAYSLNFEIKI